MRLSITRLWGLLALLATAPLLPGCIGPCGEDYPTPAPCSTPVTVHVPPQGPAILQFADGHVARPAGQLWELSSSNVYDGQQLLIDYQALPAPANTELIDYLPGITLTCMQQPHDPGSN